VLFNCVYCMFTVKKLQFLVSYCEANSVEGYCMSARVTEIIRKTTMYYVNGTLLYCFVRSVTYADKKSKEYYNTRTHSFHTHEMLLVEKISRTMHKTLSAPFLWPMMLHRDLSLLECAMRGVDSAKYGIHENED
jgi:hypothetical protein